MQRSGERHQGEAKRVVGEWVLEHRIGTGSFSVVWKAVQRCGGGRTAAIKEIATERLSDKLRESLGSELSILRNTRHENIVSFYDILKVGTAGGGPRVGMGAEYSGWEGAQGVVALLCPVCVGE